MKNPGCLEEGLSQGVNINLPFRSCTWKGHLFISHMVAAFIFRLQSDNTTEPGTQYWPLLCNGRVTFYLMFSAKANLSRKQTHKPEFLNVCWPIYVSIYVSIPCLYVCVQVQARLMAVHMKNNVAMWKLLTGKYNVQAHLIHQATSICMNNWMVLHWIQLLAFYPTKDNVLVILNPVRENENL